MVALAFLTPIQRLLIFGDSKGFLDEFDLLRDFGRGVGEIEFVSAIGTSCQFELDDTIDSFRGEWLAKVLLVTFLCTFFSFDLSFRFWIDGGFFRRFDDVGGGGLEELAEFFRERRYVP